MRSALSQTQQDALNLRYQLVPYHYSLAHVAYTEGKLISRPLMFDFPTDDVVQEVC
jgi:alpha-glucosidase